MFYFLLPQAQTSRPPQCPARTLLYLDKEEARDAALDQLANGIDVLLAQGDLAELANAQFLSAEGVEVLVEDALSSDIFMIAESIPLQRMNTQLALGH